MCGLSTNPRKFGSPDSVLIIVNICIKVQNLLKKVQNHIKKVHNPMKKVHKPRYQSPKPPSRNSMTLNKYSRSHTLKDNLINLYKKVSKGWWV